ncbi:hypothetical protein [Streptomyces sp. NPDC090022]|uniref:hypothetical protein n=1 Tax=Streptomyces sp. NPDC090022 TaxID=3365920 RepID=UPI0038084EBF
MVDAMFRLAEELIAQALYPYREELVVATKGGVVRTGPDRWYAVKAGRAEKLREPGSMSSSRAPACRPFAHTGGF